MLNYIFSHIDKIALVVWLIFFLIVLARVLRPALFRKATYGVLIGVAVLLHFLYGAFATWGQYVRWAEGGDITRSLLSSPLSSDVPFPFFLEWVRPLFEGEYGYFLHYAFTHFFLNIFALLVVVGLFILFLSIRAYYRPINFSEGDIAIVVIALLIAGWPGIIVLLPLGLLVAVIFSIFARIFYGIERITLPPAFLFASPVALLTSISILTSLNLYLLLKL